MRLAAEEVAFVSSLAGRVSRPRLPYGTVRVGGFGGVEGLAGYLRDHNISAVVDATHPFATTISAHAVAACARSVVPLLRLARPGWADLPAAGRWHWVASHDEAAETGARLGSSILLTTGRQALDRFVVPLGSHDVVARVVDPVDLDLPATWRVLIDRGPYSLAGERSLMAQHRIDVLVTKDSGGDHTRAKLDAAEELGVAVVVVRRPDEEAGGNHAVVTDVDAAVRWLRAPRARVQPSPQSSRDGRLG